MLTSTSVSLLVFSYCGYPSDFSCRDSVIFYDLKQLWADSIPKDFAASRVETETQKHEILLEIKEDWISPLYNPNASGCRTTALRLLINFFFSWRGRKTSKQPTITVRDLFVEFSVW